MGPYVLRERLGSLDPRRSPPPTSTRSSASAPRSTASRARWPPACTRWRSTSSSSTTATRRGCGRTRDSEELRDNIAGLPGYGTMKIKALGSVLFNRFGVELAQPLIPWHPTLGDVDSPQALKDYQASKKVNKALWER